MLAAMLGDDAIGNVKIDSMKEATTASRRAQRTLLAITALNAEIRAGGFQDSQRAEMESKVDSLREQYGHELRSLDVFYSALEHRGKELERILAFKDPEIERIDKELQRAYESHDRNRASEIARIRGEFERRSKELLAADPN
jgi:vacuolar-type H+-ATPase subunit I/STV1